MPAAGRIVSVRSVTRIDPPFVASERDALIGWLGYHRATLAMKCDGLSPDQLCARPIATTSMSLIGLVRHMAEVERGWFSIRIEGRSQAEAPMLYCDPDTNEDGDFDDIDPATTSDDMAAWQAEIEVSDAILDGVDLDEVRHHQRWDVDLDVRWVLVHMIEEYARHNGHADLIREAIDGTVGD
jgi:uncharacterized damage-inducible protein DinB